MPESRDSIRVATIAIYGGSSDLALSNPYETLRLGAYIHLGIAAGRGGVYCRRNFFDR
jgi:hypothetical protein